MDRLFVVFVRNLPEDFDELEAEQMGEEFGPLREAWLDETPRGELVVFLVYLDARSAQEAVEVLDGEEMDGHELRATLLEADEVESARRSQHEDHSGVIQLYPTSHDDDDDDDDFEDEMDEDQFGEDTFDDDDDHGRSADRFDPTGTH